MTSHILTSIENFMGIEILNNTMHKHILLCVLKVHNIYVALKLQTLNNYMVISVKRISDCQVFHQFLIQSSRHLLNEKETPRAKVR
jgi:hypothetical protein